MPSRLFLSNDSTVSGGGIEYDEDLIYFGTASETSAHGASALQVGQIVAKSNGVIADLVIAVGLPAVSASGFVSGTALAEVRINSAVCCSTNPSIPMAGSSGAAARKATNAGGGVSAVLNTASATFSAGDMISIDWNAVSAGSAAAGAAGKGLSGYAKLRYAAR